MSNARRVTVRLVIGFAILLAVSGVMAEDLGEEVTFTGTLVGIDEDSEGRYTRVFLRVDLRGNFLIANDEAGAELIEHAGEQVEISGRLVGEMVGDYDKVIYVEDWSAAPENKPESL